MLLVNLNRLVILGVGVLLLGWGCFLVFFFCSLDGGDWDLFYIEFVGFIKFYIFSIYESNCINLDSTSKTGFLLCWSEFPP